MRLASLIEIQILPEPDLQVVQRGPWPSRRSRRMCLCDAAGATELAMRILDPSLPSSVAR